MWKSSASAVTAKSTTNACSTSYSLATPRIRRNRPLRKHGSIMKASSESDEGLQIEEAKPIQRSAGLPPPASASQNRLPPPKQPGRRRHGHHQRSRRTLGGG